MDVCKPETPEQLARILGEAGAAGRTVTLSGGGSKQRAGGPIAPADVQICTLGLSQVFSYEPKDLTVSVGAGLKWWKFRDMLDRDGYMTPLDPPFANEATIGGIISANSSGPRRRVYGTPRDLVIGIRFATLEGKLIQSGGMVVKNVAGLDMAKLLIGSLGTLAAVAVVNFKLIPKPVGSQTFVFEFAELTQAMELRNRLIQNVLHPVALDLLNPRAAGLLGRKGWLLAAGAQGNAKVLERYQREMQGAEGLEGSGEAEFWNGVQEITPRLLAQNPDAAMVRSSVTLQALGEAMKNLPGAVVARAGNGVCYSHVESISEARAALSVGKSVMEFGPASREAGLEMWPDAGNAFPMMKRIKQMFDPKNLLNRGRLYGRL